MRNAGLRVHSPSVLVAVRTGHIPLREGDQGAGCWPTGLSLCGNSTLVHLQASRGKQNSANSTRNTIQASVPPTAMVNSSGCWQGLPLPTAPVHCLKQQEEQYWQSCSASRVLRWPVLYCSLSGTHASCRSVAGSYDNEGVAIFALVFTFYLYVKVSPLSHC